MALHYAQSPSARDALALVTKLQALLVAQLDALPPPKRGSRFRAIEWLRAGGACGGGTRFAATDEELFNRASVNISQVQYEGDPSKKLGSATALSSIVHPRNPFAPSMHLHISWTEMKSGHAYWRIMGDLNPSIPDLATAAAFENALRAASAAFYTKGREQGERYFYIPALQRHRGIAHFYLEEFRTADPEQDLALAEGFGEKVIEAYASIVESSLQRHGTFGEADRQKQLAYHSLYFLQVLTLDRGTTSGLLVHDENDMGILGSLPAYIDKDLLSSWLPRLPDLHRELLLGILSQWKTGGVCLVDDPMKARIAQVARAFYQQHPEAQDLLARGDSVPPTQENHR